MKLLYKYITAERVLTCLPKIGNGTLRATQVASLNDPFECAMVVGLASMIDSQGIAEASKILSSLNPTTPVTEEDVKDTMSTHGTLYVQHLAAKQLSQRFGIISFSTEYTDPLMWALYTEDGSGFVIGYDAEQLKPLCEVLDTVIYELRPFLISVYQPLSHEDNIHTLLRLKGHQWTHENEWRMIVRLDKTIGLGRDDRHHQPINVLPIPNEAVKTVYYTERTPKDTVELVRERLEADVNRYSATLKLLVMSETQFAYQEKDTWEGHRF
jgi:hypothetical protein